MIGLVTGSQPFAGLPDNPAALLLPEVEGAVVHGVTIRTMATPVSVAAVPDLIAGLIAEHRPAFYLALGLALGAPVLRLETTAINRLDFGVADNLGERPADGRPIDPDGPPARMASWDARALVAVLRAEGLPATVSHHAGTHLCNATLYAGLGAMATAGLPGPCGFLHLPYLPEQVARLQSAAPAAGDSAPLTERALPSMAFALQLRALRCVLDTLARTATASTGAPDT